MSTLKNKQCLIMYLCVCFWIAHSCRWLLVSYRWLVRIRTSLCGSIGTAVGREL